MAIEIFEKANTNYTYEAVVALLHDAGFTDVTYNSGGNNMEFSSDSGVYGVKSFSVYNSGAPKYVAVKDDSRKALIVFPSGVGLGDVASTRGHIFFSLMIVNGVMFVNPDDNPLSYYSNAVGGTIKDSTDTTQAMLTPFIDMNGHVFKPFYISVNRVNYSINTVVTDGTNSFTSLGNLFYIKNA